MMTHNAAALTEPDSLWTATASAQPFEAPALAGERVVEIAIVGGGFTGLSAALHAAELGASVAVLEAGPIGYGASGRNGGQVNPGVKLDETALAARFGEAGRGLYQMGQEAPDFLAALIERKGLKCHFSRPGLLRLAHHPAALATLRQVAGELRKVGVPVEDLDAADVERRVGTTRYLGGLFDRRGGSLHPLDLVRELARAARDAGAIIFPSSPALSLRRQTGNWRIATRSGALLARKVLIATNGYTDALVPGLAQSLLPVNSFQIATAPLGHELDGILPNAETVYDSRRLVLYFRRSPDGRLILGGRASFISSRQTSADAADYSVLESVLHGIFPALRETPITHHWTGLVGITFDHLPHYHSIGDDLHIMVGYNGRGVALANRIGAWLGLELAGKAEALRLPNTPITPFPFHFARSALLNVGMKWNRLLDHFGR